MQIYLSPNICRFRQTQPRQSVKIVTLALAMLLYITSTVINAQDWAYTTRPGDTLWDISKKYLKSVNYWARLQKYNSIDIAKKMPPGTRILIPIAWLRLAPTPATILSIAGDVRYISGIDGKVTKLGKDMTLTIGDKVLTGENGNVTIKFADGSTLLLQKHSELILDTLSSYGSTGMVDTQIRLQKGRLETTVNPQKKPSTRLEITTPAAVAAVRGTQFRVGYTTGNSTMQSEVVTGQISVEGAGVSQSVPKGYGTIAEVGKAPLPPKALLTAPDLSQLTTKVRRLPHPISWPPLNEAHAYRIQLTQQLATPALVVDTLTKSPEFALDKLADGTYQLAIRGIDELNLEGFNATHTLEVSTDLPVVTLLIPDDKTPLYDGIVGFRWQKPDGASRFRLQVASESNFDSISIDQIVTETGFHSSEALTPGEYAWRVAAVDSDGNEGEFSAATKFTVRNLPSAPQVDVDTQDLESNQGQFTLTWPSVEQASEYLVQVAKDEAFNEVIVRETTTSNKYTHQEPLPQGTYYYRAKSIITKNVQSDYSATKQFTINEEKSLILWLWLLLIPLMI